MDTTVTFELTGKFERLPITLSELEWADQLATIQSFERTIIRNVNKDCAEFFIVMNNKPLLVQRILQQYPTLQTAVWIDFGIAHILAPPVIPPEYLEQLFERVEANTSNQCVVAGNYVHLLREQSKTCHSPNSRPRTVNWTFLGGIFGGNRTALLNFAAAAKNTGDEFIHKKCFFWEVNAWYHIFRQQPELFDFYWANHNKSMFLA